MFKIENYFNIKQFHKYFATKARRNTKKVELYGDSFPKKILTKKQKTPNHYYIANDEAANDIYKSIEPYLRASKANTLYEINPGIGLITQRLQQYNGDNFKKIILMESMNHFQEKLQEFQSDRIKVKTGDLVSMWKLTYMDKMDQGSRVMDILADVTTKNFNEDPSFVIVGAVGAYKFYKHLINSIVFQNGIFSKGRAEMLLIVPPQIYIHLTCNNKIGYLIYRSTSILFQILFEYKFIAKIPRANFLPTQSEYSFTKNSKLGKLQSIDTDYLYLIRIVPRQNVYDLCPIEDLPALWYFIKQNCVSRRNRIIPNLEKLIPGCGPRLIINPRRPLPVHSIYNENFENLPDYSEFCTTMHGENYHKYINIYTQFGDLNPSQMLTLFKQFREWPEFVESSFLASLENTLLKMSNSIDESIDVVTEEDDMINDTTENDEQSTNIETNATIKLPK